MNELESLKKKIIYRANYRGTKEMDMLLGGFVNKYINTFNKDELEELYIFLNMEDEVIYNFYQTKKIDTKFKNLKLLEMFSNFKI